MKYSCSIAVAVFSGTIFAACTSESPQVSQGSSGTNHPPEIRVAKILPNPLLLDGVMTVQIEADDADRNPVSFRYRWLVNGKPVVGESGAVLDPQFMKRDDVVVVEVTPFDATSEGELYRTEGVKVGNTPPDVKTLVLEPREPYVGVRLEAKAEAVDLDRDDIRLIYRWKRNKNVAAEGEQAQIDTAAFVRGDVLEVEVIAADQFGQGKPFVSDPVVIANSPPTITSSPQGNIQNGLYIYDVKAIDRDKDPLKYVLENAPPGMVIDQATGRIEWRPAPNVKGAHRVRIAVSDQQGGTPAFQDFELALGLSPAS